MIIVPLASDTIETKDGAKLLVAGYNNFKNKGPAVYCKADPDSPTLLTIYFFDIEKINDVRVEFSASNKTFTALGRVKRKLHLPQPHDTITVFAPKDVEEGSNKFDESKKVKVQSLKLHSKKYGIAKGLLIEDEDKNVYMLDEILDLKRDSGSSEFDKKVFLRIYKEYTGHRP